MFVTSTDPQEIENIIQMWKQTNSIGYDGLSSYVIKKTILDISVSLSIVFNISLTLGQFPDPLKVAKIVPIYKSEDKKLVGNYRPISIFSFFKNRWNNNV